jgi:HAE1 family hydrophobic/amphiphilic exporter-1
MFISDLAVKRPVLTTVFILTFVILGFVSYSRLVIELFPSIDFPFVTVNVIYPGAGPAEIESQVTKPVEDAVSTISGVKRIDSIVGEGFSLTIIEFELEMDVDIVAMDVRDKIDATKYELPSDIEDPVIEKFDVNAFPIMNLAVYGDRGLDELFEIADDVIEERLTRVPGIARVDIIGGQEREIVVALKREKLKAYGLSVPDIVMAVAAENLSVPSGRITDERNEISLRMLGEVESPGELAEIRVPVGEGAFVRLGDLGRVEDTFVELREVARYNQSPSVSLSIMKRADANTVETAEGVTEVLPRIRSALPHGVELDVVEDRSGFISDTVQSVISNMFLGILLTSILLYLFLHSWRSTVVAALAMPTSIISTFLLIDFAGFSLNIMSLMALGISIGILLTNAIVVLENISRHLRDTGDPIEAAKTGASEIALAVVASTMTNVVVFTPVAFMSGMVGRFFLQFGMTAVFATVMSLVVSFTIVPMLSSRVLGRLQLDESTARYPWERFSLRWDKGFRSLRDSYENALDWALDHKKVVFGLITLLFIGAIMLLGVVGGEFMPMSDQGLLTIVAETSPGTSLEEASVLLAEVEKVVAEIPEVTGMLTTIGGPGVTIEYAEILVTLLDADERDRGVLEIMNELRPKLARVPGLDTRVARPSWGSRAESDITMQISSEDVEEIKPVADQVAEVARGITGLTDVKTSWRGGKPELRFAPDFAKAAERGFTSAQIAMGMRASYEGEVASIYREGDKEYDVRVRLAEEDRSSLDDVGKMPLTGYNGASVLSQLGDLEMGRGESELERRDKRRIISVEANISKGTLTEKIEALSQAFAENDLPPPGTEIFFAGEAEYQEESFASIFTALILAIILTYIVLAAILESFIQPITVMLTLPLGLIGASIALVLGAQSINIVSLMALVMLVGIVVNNAILILDYTAQLRAKGRDRMEALKRAASVRFRPIVMTNLAIAIGMFPQALGGAGAEFRTSMAIVTMGGVLISATFTLFLIPVFYTSFENLMDRFRRGSK